MSSGKKHVVLSSEQDNLWFEMYRTVAKNGGTRQDFVEKVKSSGQFPSALYDGDIEDAVNAVSSKLSQSRNALISRTMEAAEKAGITKEAQPTKFQALVKKLDAKVTELFPEFKRGRNGGSNGASKHAELITDLLDGLDEVEGEETV